MRSLIWKSLSTKGSWSKSLWGALTGATLRAMGVSISGSYGFRNENGAF